MTADILQCEGLEPVKYASSDRLIINYERRMIWKKATKYIGRKTRFSPQFFTEDFYIDIKRFNSKVTKEI